MKDQILELLSAGKTPTQIKNELGCSRSIVYYHCSEEERIKSKERAKSYRNNNPEWEKVQAFKARKTRNSIKSVRKFQRENNQRESNFTWKDILKKFGTKTKCYLTGVDIDLEKDDFTLDHIIPVSRGGSNNIDNLGITTSKANKVKCDLLLEELIEICNKIIKNLVVG